MIPREDDCRAFGYLCALVLSVACVFWWCVKG